jgi:hypothetical protein
MTVTIVGLGVAGHDVGDDEAHRLLRIVRRSNGSVVTWRRARMVLLSAQGMPVAKIAEVTSTLPPAIAVGRWSSISPPRRQATHPPSWR